MNSSHLLSPWDVKCILKSTTCFKTSYIISVLDELLSGLCTDIIILVTFTQLYYCILGLISKAKGQILRVSALLHIFFCDSIETETHRLEVS